LQESKKSSTRARDAAVAEWRIRGCKSEEEEKMTRFLQQKKRAKKNKKEKEIDLLNNKNGASPCKAKSSSEAVYTEKKRRKRRQLKSPHWGKNRVERKKEDPHSSNTKDRGREVATDSTPRAPWKTISDKKKKKNAS